MSNLDADIIQLQVMDGMINHYHDKNSIIYDMKSLKDYLQNEYIANRNKFAKDNEAVIELLDHITSDKEKANSKLFIVSAAYDKIYKRYYAISLSVLILSSLVTLIEALRLSIVEFVNKEYIENVNTSHISFVMNIMTLTTGTVITVLSSIIRFKNYREILEQLKDKQNILIDYRDKYNKKYEQVLNLLAIDRLKPEDIRIISEKIIEYDNSIKSINILEHIRNNDIIKFNRYKAYFELSLEKIKIDKQMAITNYKNKLVQDNGNDVKTMHDVKNDDKITHYMKLQKLKNIIWQNGDVCKKCNEIDDEDVP